MASCRWPLRFVVAVAGGSMLALGGAPRAHAQSDPLDQRRVGVLEIKAEGGVDPALSRQLTARIAERLSARPGWRVLAPDDIRAILEREAQKQLMGCEDETCLVELAGALGADVLVSGRVTKLESAWAVSMSAVNPRRAEAIGHATERWGGRAVGLLELVEPLVERLLPSSNVELSGALRIEGAVDGTQVFLDDQIRGTAPFGRMDHVPIGGRRVSLVHPDQKPIEKWVVVRRGKTTSIAIQQTPLSTSAFYETWWFWTVAGAAVAGAAVATVVATSQDSPADVGSGVQVSLNADNAFTGGR